MNVSISDLYGFSLHLFIPWSFFFIYLCIRVPTRASEVLNRLEWMTGRVGSDVVTFLFIDGLYILAFISCFRL